MTDTQGGADEPNALVAGRYRLVRRIGSGGTSTVWAATDESEGRPVALSTFTLPRDSAEDHGVAMGRALREARRVARFEHPHAVRVYDVFQHHGEPCLVTELVPGRPLPDLLGERHTLDEQETARLGAQVAAALAAAHAAGIVHGNVTPAAILVADDGTAWVSELGIAPEAGRDDEAGYASDVFSLGSVLYASLEGAPPSEPAVPPQHAGALTPVLLRMLAPDAGARPTMAEVAQQLARIAPADPGEPAGAPTSPRPRGGRRGLLVVAVVAAAALLVAGILLLRPRGDSGPAAGPQPAPSSTTASGSPSATAATPTPATSTPPPVTGPPSANQLAAAVTRYYSLLPGNPDEAFALLTTDYQTRVAGGRQAYQRFVDGFSAVTATDVTGSPPSTVTATVTYTTKSGQVTRERTTFGLVDDGGVLKIGSSTVTGRA